MSKRHSILPPLAQQGPKPPVQLSKNLGTIADSAVLTGTHSIIVGAETVIHPRCRLESMAGSIFVDRRCILQERCHIGAPAADDSLLGGGGVALGEYVTVEIGAVVEAGGTDIGEGCVIGIGARIGAGAKLGKNCTIAAKAVIAPREVIDDCTVVYADGMRRADKRDIMSTRNQLMLAQIDVLRKLIPSKPEKFL